MKEKGKVPAMPVNTEDQPGELELLARPKRGRDWLAQADFWEGVKEFILKRVPGRSRSVDQLY